jgi:hypothetical protein
MRRRSLVSTSLAVALAAAGCDAILGIHAGEPGGSSASTGGSSASTGGASTASSASGTGGGDAGPGCPFLKSPPCHVDGGSSEPCDAIIFSPTVTTANTFGILVIGDYVYWADGMGHVVRVRFDGAPDSSFGKSADTIFIAADQSRVYITEWNDPVIRSATLAAPHLLADVSVVSGPMGSMPAARFSRIALSPQGALYWTSLNPNGVWTANTDGSQPTAAPVASKVDDPVDFDRSTGVAVDATHVYWTDADTVLRIPLTKLGDPSAVEPPVALDPGAGEVAVDDTWVYWTNDHGLAYKPKAGGGQFTSYTAPDANLRGRALLLDGNYIYWSLGEGASSTGTAQNMIVRAPRGGGPATVVALSPPGAYALAADCGAIYWTIFDRNHEQMGTVQKVRKPQ